MKYESPILEIIDFDLRAGESTGGQPPITCPSRGADQDEL